MTYKAWIVSDRCDPRDASPVWYYQTEKYEEFILVVSSIMKGTFCAGDRLELRSTGN